MKLSKDQIEEELSRLEGWSLAGNYIVKEIKTKDWKRTMFAVNAIASLAEAHWHHPDLEVSFGKIRIKLTTHDVGGITRKDIELARAIDDMLNKIL